MADLLSVASVIPSFGLSGKRNPRPAHGKSLLKG